MKTTYEIDPGIEMFTLQWFDEMTSDEPDFAMYFNHGAFVNEWSRAIRAADNRATDETNMLIRLKEHVMKPPSVPDNAEGGRQLHQWDTAYQRNWQIWKRYIDLIEECNNAST